MAEREVKTIITIDAQRGTRSLRDFRQQVSECKGALDKAVAGTEEYERALVDLKTAQGAYNKELRVCVKENQQAEGSYNKLTAQLARLKEQWKATGDAAERARLTKQVNAIKGQLNEMDHSIGNWQHNVGNYWGGIKGGLKKLTLWMAAAQGAFKLFSSAISSTQAGGDALRNSLSGVKSSFDSLMTAVVTSDWSAFSGGFWAVYDAAAAAAEAIDQLRNTQLAFDYLSSENTTKFNEQYNIWKDPQSTQEQKDAAKAQMKEIIDAQFAYAASYSTTALDAYRKKVVEAAGAGNLEARQVTDAQFRRAMMIDVSADPKAGRAEIDRQYREYLAKLAEYNGNNLTAQKQLSDRYRDVIAIHAMLQLMEDDELKGLADIMKGIEGAKQSALAMQRRMNRGGGTGAATRSGGGAKVTVDEVAKALENVAVDADQYAGEVIAAVDAELAATLAAGVKQDKEQAKRDAAKEKHDAESNRAHEQNLLGRIDADAKADEVRARAAEDNERKLAAILYGIEKEAAEKRIALLRQFAREAALDGRLQDAANYTREAADLEVQVQLNAITEKARLRRQDAAAAKKAAAEQLRVQQATATATATLFGNVASAYQAYLTQRVEGGKMSEKTAEEEFQVIKNIQQAQTWISTLSGMMSVWAGEGTTAFKIAQSAAVFSQGLAATMQIANTTLGSVAKAAQSVTSAAVAAPVVLTAMPQVQTVTSASQEDVLNQRAAAQRVYVVYSDIAQAGKRVRVTDSESRF